MFFFFLPLPPTNWQAWVTATVKPMVEESGSMDAESAAKLRYYILLPQVGDSFGQLSEEEIQKIKPDQGYV